MRLRVQMPEWFKDPLKQEMNDNMSLSVDEASRIISSPVLNGSVVVLESVFENIAITVPEPRES